MKNFIHETAIISPKAIMGDGNYFGPYVVVYDNVVIGNNNHFQSHASIGSSAEHKDPMFDPRQNEQDDCFVYIGDANIIREFVTINKPTTSKKTEIGNGCYIMRSSHVGHDTIIENNVIMSCNVTLGGHSHIMSGAYLAINSATHPYTIVGAYAMLGMGCITVKGSRIEPGKIYIGSPAEYLKDNIIGLNRAGVVEEHLSKEIDRFRCLLGYL